MNKWKIAFWTYLSLSLMFIICLLYRIVDQGVTLTHMRDGYTKSENDLTIISEIISESDFTREQAKFIVTKDSTYLHVDFSKDTIELQNVKLVFDQEKLCKILANP